MSKQINSSNFLPTSNLGAIPVYADKFNSVVKDALNETQDTRTGAGAVSTTTRVTWIVTTAADALTLADGYEGQEKFLIMKTDGGDGTLTPTNLGNGTTLTFDDAGDSAHLLFTNGNWYFMGGSATLA